MLRRLKDAVKPAKLRPVLEKQAWKTFARLVSDTPKRFTGQTRKEWSVKADGDGFYVGNPSKVMLFLEEGTQAHGAANGGMLYIPLNANAMIYRKGLIFGRDFRLARHVRGITARHIVADEKETTREELRDALITYLRGEMQQ